MIYGIGVDLVQTSRIAKILERHGERFSERILHPQERMAYAEARDKANYLAKAFAAKEALVKALGTGFRGIAHDEVGSVRGELGRPVLVYSEKLEATLRRLGIAASHISISDERDMVCAMVVLER